MGFSITSNNTQHDPQLVAIFTEALGCQSGGNLSGALIAYKRIQRQFPDFIDAWINASSLLQMMGRMEEALDSATRAAELGSQSPEVYNALANAQISLGLLEGASENLNRVLAKNPQHPEAISSLANICGIKGKYEEALELENRALQLMPLNPDYWLNRSKAKIHLMDLAGSEADSQRALELDGSRLEAFWNIAHIQLLQYRYKEAWVGYRARPDRALGKVTDLCDGKPIWTGENLNGRTLLVHAEYHGFGDTIQMARFFPCIQKQYDGRVILSTFKPLKRLLENVAGIDDLLIEDEPRPHYDLVLPVLKIPIVLDIDPSDLPPPINISTEYRPMPELTRPGFKVGLVWGGNPVHIQDTQRSMSQRHLDTLADLTGIAWYSLQIPPSPEPPALPGLIDMSPHISDFMDTAQIIKQLDLIVTVDTSVAHLAGSLNIPTIVLLQYIPEWRWGLKEHTPWYPTLTLIKTPGVHDWDGAIALLREQLLLRKGKSM
jgi:Flp pilus assembly protein TadD